MHLFGFFFRWGNSEGDGQGDSTMVLGQDYKQGTAKYSKKIPIIFGECSKMCEVERCHTLRLCVFYWPILDAFGLLPLADV